MKAQNRPVQAAVNQLKPVTPKWPIRRWVRIAHLWAGVGLGLWVVMLGLRERSRLSALVTSDS
jgi:hypothetical protein